VFFFFFFLPFVLQHFINYKIESTPIELFKCQKIITIFQMLIMFLLISCALCGLTNAYTLVSNPHVLSVCLFVWICWIKFSKCGLQFLWILEVLKYNWAYLMTMHLYNKWFLHFFRLLFGLCKLQVLFIRTVSDVLV